MTSTELIAKMRSALDEPTSAFYTDTELYNYLTNAQRAVFAYLLSLYREGKRSLHGNLSKLMSIDDSVLPAPTTSVSLPSDFWSPLAVHYIIGDGTVKREAKIVGGTLQAYKLTNSYLNDNDSLSVRFLPTTLEFSASISYRILEYLKQPTAITSLANPILNDDATDAVLNHALSNAFAKDAKTNMDVSGQYINLFFKALEGVQ